MTGQFEQEVRLALQVFIATVTRAAERAAVEAIRSSFSRTSSTPTGKRVSPDSSRPLDDATHRARLAAYLRDNPGKSPTHLRSSLGINVEALRRLLTHLVEEGTIRIEERVVGHGRRQQRHRACFLVASVLPVVRAASPPDLSEAVA